MKRLTYGERRKFHMYFALIEALLAFVILVIGIICHTQFGLLNHHMSFETFIAFSAGMFGSGLCTYYKNHKLLSQPEQLHTAEVRDMDERNQFISSQSARIAFWIMLILIYIAAFISLFFNTTFYFLLCGQLLIMVILYLLCAYIIGHHLC